VVKVHYVLKYKIIHIQDFIENYNIYNMVKRRNFLKKTLFMAAGASCSSNLLVILW